MLELYYAPGTVALATHIALIDAGAEFQLRRVDFAKEEQRGEAYHAVNPKGRVPALVTPRGILTETPALLAWVAETFPAARLAPAGDPFAFAEMQAFNAYLCSTLHPAHAHKMRGYRWTDDPAAQEALKRYAPTSIAGCWEYVEATLRGPFVMGADYTVADPYLFTIAQWMEGDSVDPARFPKVAAHREMMRGRASVQAALAAQGR